jgi:hypothetical protein
MHMITSLQLHSSPIICIGAVVVVIVWELDLQLPVQSVPISTNFESSNLARCEVYSMQHHVMMLVSDLQQVSGSLRVLRFPLLRKLTATI